MKPMIYRVFLQEDSENVYRIRHGEKYCWYYNCPPGYMPDLESQLISTGPGSCVYVSEKSLDGHLLIKCDWDVISVIHKPEEIPEKTYQLAKHKAQKLTEELSKKTGKEYIFIDLTTKGDKILAEKLSQKINYETEDYIPTRRRSSFI